MNGAQTLKINNVMKVADQPEDSPVLVVVEIYRYGGHLWDRRHKQQLIVL
jgi:TPP-dependent pyruvate/acetoin dehydrogenase alpha subunit